MDKAVNVIMPAYARSAIYESFAAGFTILPTTRTLKLFNVFASELHQFLGAASFAKLAAEAGVRLELGKDRLESVRQDYYDHLFVPTSGRYVPPFESALTSKALWGEETKNCAECYAAVNFEPRELDIFPPLKEIAIPDHIGFQLAFLAFLARMENEAQDEERAEAWRSLQLDFAQRHLLNWLPLYANAKAEVGDSFFSALAASIVDYIAGDVAVLQDLQRMRGDLN